MEEKGNQQNRRTDGRQESKDTAMKQRKKKMEGKGKDILKRGK
jgi:hypothetical protein